MHGGFDLFRAGASVTYYNEVRKRHDGFSQANECILFALSLVVAPPPCLTISIKALRTTYKK